MERSFVHTLTAPPNLFFYFFYLKIGQSHEEGEGAKKKKPKKKTEEWRDQLTYCLRNGTTRVGSTAVFDGAGLAGAPLTGCAAGSTAGSTRASFGGRPGPRPATEVAARPLVSGSCLPTGTWHEQQKSTETFPF